MLHRTEFPPTGQVSGYIILSPTGAIEEMAINIGNTKLAFLTWFDLYWY